MNIWKIIHLHCGERYEDMIDHCSYTPNLNGCEIKACWKKFRSEQDLNPWPLRYWCCVTLWVGNILIEGSRRMKMNIWKIIYLNCVEDTFSFTSNWVYNVLQYTSFLILLFYFNTGIQPDVTIYNGLLSVYIQNNHRFNPLEVLEQMQERKVEPNRVS